jgi:hypothetical protein
MENWHKVGVDDVFAYNIALTMITNNEDDKSNSIKDYRQSENWPKWKDAIDEELNLLYKQQVFGLVVFTWTCEIGWI